MRERGVRVAGELPPELVYAGFSFGVLPAQKLAQTRPGALLVGVGLRTLGPDAGTDQTRSRPAVLA